MTQCVQTGNTEASRSKPQERAWRGGWGCRVWVSELWSGWQIARQQVLPDAAHTYTLDLSVVYRTGISHTGPNRGISRALPPCSSASPNPYSPELIVLEARLPTMPLQLPLPLPFPPNSPKHTQVDAEGSRKELVVSERQAALTEAVQQFTPGQVVRGQVLRLEDYGALISLYNSQVGHTMAAHTQSTHLSH